MMLRDVQKPIGMIKPTRPIGPPNGYTSILYFLLHILLYNIPFLAYYLFSICSSRHNFFECGPKTNGLTANLSLKVQYAKCEKDQSQFDWPYENIGGLVKGHKSVWSGLQYFKTDHIDPVWEMSKIRTNWTVHTPNNNYWD